MDDEQFFLNSGSEQLKTVHGWAQARMASPRALLFGVLVRVAASVPPAVQLPPVVGDRASLNLLCAFVGKSGTGKGITTKVAARAWPADILTLPIGSGQGIAEAFTRRSQGDEVHPVIFDVPEIDTMAGLARAQGSVLLPTLKSMAMGEQLGQANATKDARRNVPAHSYRACLSAGVQPGHADVIFDDATGGTPQRFLWVPVTDPNISPEKIDDPDPLVTDMPIWTPGNDGVVEMVYSTPEIERSIIESHVARQRGDGDALDGHALLTRCKVASLLAIMHQRVEVTAWDWHLSGQIMTVSEQSRAALRQQEAEIRAAAIRERGRYDALRHEGRDDYQLESVKGSVVTVLTKRGGSASASDLNSAMGKPHRRKLLPQALAELMDEGRLLAISVAGGMRYQLKGAVQDERAVQGLLPQVGGDEPRVQDEHSATVVSLDQHRPQSAATPKMSCQKWFDGHLADLHAQGHDTAEGAAVRKAGIAAGYSKTQLYVAANTRCLKGTDWPLTG
jgi:hypothetical protein